jgi:trk system potassium uptake protein TrkA
MRKIIIVGASRVGLEVARSMNNSVLIEADPAKFTILRRQNPDRDILGGDARQPETLIRAGIQNADALVLLSNKDYVNIKVALAAKEFNVPKVISRLYDEKYRQDMLDAGVTHIISPQSVTMDAVLERVFPDREIITDVVITAESPVCGKTIGDITLPQNCVVGAMMRGGRLHNPRTDIRLAEGDTLSLVSLGDVDVEIFETLAGGFSPYIPHEKIVFLLRNDTDLQALAEVAFLAKRLDVPCEVVTEAKDERLMVKVTPILEKSGCRFSFNMVIGDVLGHFRRFASKFGQDSGVLLALHQARKGMLGHLIQIKYINGLLANSAPPLLIARGNRYGRILHLLDSSRVGERCTRCAVGLAINTSTKLFALYPHLSGSAEHDIVRAHTKRMARIYDINVVEDIVEGDPTIELVQKVKSTDSQLVLVNWANPSIRKDILVRIINDAGASVLVVERQAKV